MNILIKDILAVLPTENGLAVKPCSIYIENGQIVSLDAAPEGFFANKTIDGQDKLAIPGLMNCHTHSYMALFRGAADDVAFEDWLFKGVMPLEDKMEMEDAYWGASLAILEMMKSGTTCFSDMQMHINQTTRAVSESGMRAVICRGLVGTGNDETGATKLREAFEEMENWKSCDRLTFRLGPHAPYTCDPGYLEIVANKAKEKNLGIHIHLSESAHEVAECKEKYGCTPIALAEKTGIFDVPTLAAHCVHITPDDMDILKRKNVSVVTNPASNMKLGNGFAPIPELLAHGVNVCIGTDGAASNNTLNLFHEMSLLALIHKGARQKAQCVSAHECMMAATANAAKALGLAQTAGSIAPGMRADIAILNLNEPSLTPRSDLLSALSYSVNGAEVDTVLIDGNVTMEHRKVLTMDEERILFEAKRIAARLGLA